MYTDKILEKFASISAIPRRSGEEEQIRSWITSWAEDLGFQAKTDKVGNLCVSVPARGIERDPIVIQGHLDMVCEKTPDSNHDFSKDGLQLRRNEDWLDAENTTLGADNGIAIAFAMVLAETSDINIPPLELLFTVDEETGLTGASELDASIFEGKTLLNIDSEDEGVFTVGCAGGKSVHIELPFKRVNTLAKDAQFFNVSVSGARGGHSGIDIHKERANAICVLSRALIELRKDYELFIAQIDGGTAHNAIPRESTAQIVIERLDDENALLEAFARLNKLLKKEFETSDPKLELKIEKSKGKTYFTKGATEKLLNLVHSIPHGVDAMSLELKGIVDSSGNFAMIQTHESAVHILTSHRSSQGLRIESLAERVAAIGHLAEAKVRFSDSYPAWQPDWNSELLHKAKAIYHELFGKDAIVEVIHAGLECGIIGEKKPGMQMISFGPTIENAHSPDERLKISDVNKIWNLLVNLVQNV